MWCFASKAQSVWLSGTGDLSKPHIRCLLCPVPGGPWLGQEARSFSWIFFDSCRVGTRCSEACCSHRSEALGSGHWAVLGPGSSMSLWRPMCHTGSHCPPNLPAAPLHLQTHEKGHQGLQLQRVRAPSRCWRPRYVCWATSLGLSFPVSTVKRLGDPINGNQFPGMSLRVF